MLKRVSIYADLIKYKLSLAVVLSSVTGYYLHSNIFNKNLIFLASGVFLLAAGAAVLNQFTERVADSIMERTKKRPIPSKEISETGALWISSFLLLSGSIFLFINGAIPFLLGITTVLLYNFLYTYLKKKTILSIIPGALVGAIPPLIGFSSAGGNIGSANILVFSGFMFLWQLPHFWLIIIRYGSEYRKAGFATISSYLNENQIILLTFFWILLSTMFLILFGMVSGTFSFSFAILLAILNVVFIFFFYKALFIRERLREIKGAFIMMNFFSLIVMFLIIVLSLIKG